MSKIYDLLSAIISKVTNAVNAIPKKLSELENDAGFITEQKQADWNQNDPTAADYVKNRPFYETDDGGVVKIDAKYLPESSSENTDYKLTILAVKCTYLEEGEDPIVELVRGSYEDARSALLSDDPVAGYLCKNNVMTSAHRTEVSPVIYLADSEWLALQDSEYDYRITPDNTVEID